MYEQDTQTPRSVQFWFENRNPNPVTLQLKGVSCLQCSRGTVIVIPPEVTRNLQQYTAAAALPIGPFNPYGVGLTQPLAQLKDLPRTSYEFRDNPNATYQIPAATNPDKWSPQWGMLEIGFKVMADPGQENVKPLDAFFNARVDGTAQSADPQFRIGFEVARPCEVWPPSISIGRLGELSTDKEYGFLVYSSTRGPDSEFGDLVLTKDLAAHGTGGAAPIRPGSWRY